MRSPVAAIALVLLAGCSGAQPGAPTPPGAPIRVLMLTATAGFRHDSIAAAREAMTALGSSTAEFVVTPTEDLTALSTVNLASDDVPFFALTTGELPLTDAQKAAVLAFVSGGKGFIGAHSASDTLYDWPDTARWSAPISGNIRGRRTPPWSSKMRHTPRPRAWTRGST